MAQGGSVLDLILTVGPRSSGWGALRAAAAAERRGQGSCGGGVARVSESGVPGADSSRIWVGRHLRDMGKPMEATSGNGRARECENGCGGGSAWRITPASGVLASSASYGSSQLAQSDQLAS